MAGSVNRVTLLGVLGRDPEVRSFDSGGQVCNLRVACSESWRDKATGERKERTEWVSVVIRNEELVKVAEQHLRKGSKVYLEGRLETRKYEKDGRDHYTTEVVLRPYQSEMVILSWPDGERDIDREGDNRSGRGERRSAADTTTFDDEVPF